MSNWEGGLAVWGYARVSTLEQNTAAQLAAFKRAGIVRVVQERRSAAKDRPVLEKLLKRLQPGDVLAVYKLDRLARSVRASSSNCIVFMVCLHVVFMPT